MKQYNYILFDWDGCIAKTLDIWLDAYKKTFAEFDVHPTKKEIASEAFGDWEAPRKFGIDDTKKFSDILVSRVETGYPHVELYPNVRSAIDELKSNDKKLALISSSKKNLLLKAIENNNLTDTFDVFLSADDVVHHKPDPEPLYKALGLLAGIKDEAIMVGDSRSDLGAAKNAGIDSILFHPDHNKLFYDLETLKTFHPTYIIQDFKDLDSIIV